MLKKVLIAVGILALLGVVAVAVFFIQLEIRAGDGEASEEISAPTLVAPTGEAATSTAAVFRIVPEDSEVRFRIDEELRGSPFEVVGTTKDVAGDILIDTQSPANSEVGTIRINVRTLETDDRNRTNALRADILRSARDEFEFAEFVPTSVVGLPERVEVGTPFSFTIIGNLTVSGATNEVTFQATVTPVSEERIEGSASAIINYPDYVTMTRLPGFVANVSDAVDLEIDFAAVRVADSAS